ncbi:hypothetical protein AYO21_05938 [Fonsecaea monophora]|uniref:protein disulfide-isomerase n=1 Tax=Fonsecaea monophora TaxID=254056 RepID=A0A177F8W1_9EURO|nr:hypothetical protein AYO21_05938 [Fonsecaea monophora]OAG39872.1 hypothetical protein AYO21_05938 [Fonsecaea monophora]
MKAQILVRTWVTVFALIQVHGCKAVLEYAAPATLKALVSTAQSKDNLVIAVFCLPWYEQCKALAPELEKVKEALQPWPSAQLLLINCEDKVDIEESSGLPREYCFRRDFTALIFAALEAFGTLKSLDVPLLLFVVSEDEAPELSTVRAQVAEKLQDKFLVATTTDLTLAEEADIPPPFVVVWNSLDEVKPIYRDKFEMGPILRFAEQTSTPVIGRLDLKSYIDHTQSKLPIAFILAETDRERKTIAESLKHVALKYKGKIDFVTLDTTKLPFLLEPLDVDATRLPALALHRGDDDEVFVYDQNRQINRRDVETFIQRTIHRPVTEL